MAEISFDDLIPKPGAKTAAGAFVKPAPLSFDDLVPSPVGFWDDLGKTAVNKTVQSIVDFPGVVGDIDQATTLVGSMIGDLARRGDAMLTTGEDPGRAPVPPERLLKKIAPTSQEFEDFVGFKPYEPKYGANKVIGEVLRFLPGAAVGGGVSAALRGGSVPGAMISQGAKYAPAGGTGELAAQAAEGTGWEDEARLVGALVGGFAPGVTRKVITPSNIHPENARMAQALRREGVTTITEGQVKQSPKLLVKERQTPGVERIQVEQGEQYTRAALRRVGENADRATPEVMDRALRRIGGEFNRLSANNQLVLDQQFANDLNNTVTWYAGRVSPPNRAPLIQDYLSEIQNLARGGNIAGEAYQSLRSRISADARSVTDPYTSRTLNDLASDLDDAMERSIAQNNPGDVGAFRDARRQYRDFLVLERAMSGAGSDAALGLVTPSALRSATAITHGRRNYVTGQGDFAELARAGEALMRPLPQTGYAPAVRGLTDMNSLAMVLAAVPRGLRRLRMSPLGRRYMSNQLMPRTPFDPLVGALAQGSNLVPMAAGTRD